jgi:hypothetical protein
MIDGTTTEEHATICPFIPEHEQRVLATATADAYAVRQSKFQVWIKL